MVMMAKAVAGVLVALAVIGVLVVINSADNPGFYIGSVIGCLVGAAFFALLGDILDTLVQISGRLYWLMPPEYHAANPSDVVTENNGEDAGAKE